MAVRPPSPASRLLQGVGTSVKTGWLSGRHRQQAGSYKGWVQSWKQVGCQDAIAGKPALQKQAGIHPLLTTHQAER
ncbi:hypothetical protein EMIT0P44_40027 [Pseudomonas sp. IT-P44]